MSIAPVLFATRLGGNALFLLHCKSTLEPVESIAMQTGLWVTQENVGQRERKGDL